MTAQATAPAPGPLTFLTDTRIITVRNVRRMARTPQMLYFASIQPVVFIIVFRYVFGGAIATPGYSYVNYLMPGLLVEATLFGATTAVALAADLSGGLVDRFRSLPVARPAVLAARTLADFCRTIIVVAVVLAVGSLVGFRFNNGALAGAAAIGLVLAFAYAYSWLLASKRSTCSPLVQALTWSRPKLMRNQVSPYRGFSITISCAGGPPLRLRCGRAARPKTPRAAGMPSLDRTRSRTRLNRSSICAPEAKIRFRLYSAWQAE